MSFGKQLAAWIGGEAWSNSIKSGEAIKKIEMPRQDNMFSAIPEAVFNSRKNAALRADNPDLERLSAWDSFTNAHKKANGEGYDYAKIAGSTMVAGVGYRALSGGGVYRDSNGNTDVAGIPFV